ncbi:hypothetical protein MKJ04_08490 [Pontibacter sp. E15-1]|uniref:hypothetical protein n=1 Tax=Pontibacter sp. E15-1 TaxID=2919918 RepID=UPI001F501867|nr:hypothetical protein [Pontibacter sp. E15-1]MCJ8164880.1 hypothetical protein [Pontibacter sp. E15-1]
MKKRYLTIGDFKRNAFIVAAAACMGLTSCSSNPDQNEWNAESEMATTDGIITEMTEQGPDQWKITDERTTAPGKSMAILKYNDGRIDTLQGLELQNRLQDMSRNEGSYRQGGYGMSSVLWWSALGYMAGRNTGPRAGYYANPNLINRTDTWRQNVQTSRQRATAPGSGRSGFFRGRSGGAGA